MKALERRYVKSESARLRSFQSSEARTEGTFENSNTFSRSTRIALRCVQNSYLNVEGPKGAFATGRLVAEDCPYKRGSDRNSNNFLSSPRTHEGEIKWRLSGEPVANELIRVDCRGVLLIHKVLWKILRCFRTF